MSTLALALLAAVVLALPASAATVYYVAPAGSDSAAGTSAAPFRTVQKCASVAIAGDTCAIRTGTYRETVVPANSGTAGNPIRFTAAPGAVVTFDGSDPVSGWTAHTGQIYRASVSMSPNLKGRQLFQGSTSMPSARWPVSGTDLMHPNRATAGSGTTHDASTGVSTVVDANLGSGWVGGTITFWGGYAWLAQTATVTSSTAGQLTFSGGTAQCAASPFNLLCVKPGTRYYVSGTLSALTAPGQWFYDSAAQYLYYWAPAGGAPTGVTVKQRTWAFNLTDRSYITIEGIKLFGASVTTNSVTKTDTSIPGLAADCNQIPDPSHAGGHNVIDGITATYVSQVDKIGECARTDDVAARLHLADTGIALHGTANTLRNSTIAWSASNGVAVFGDSNVVTNNLIHDVDYMGTYAAGVYIHGTGNEISRNTVYNTGQGGIVGHYFGDGIPPTGVGDFTGNRISYNDVFNFGLLDQDGGGIYLCCSESGAGGSIDHNWVHDGMQPMVLGFGGALTRVQSGIYLDAGSQDFTITRNVVWNLAANGMLINGRIAPGPQSQPQNVKVYNNTFADTPTSFYAGDSFLPNLSGSVLANNVFTGVVQLNGMADPTLTTNLTSGTPAGLISSTSSDHRLAAGSAAIDAGTVIAGVTDGYVGSAPDQGAYEYGGDAWVPGCSLTGCRVPNDAAHSLDDSAAALTGTWTSAAQSLGFNNSMTYSTTAGSRATFTFSGTQAQLYGIRSNVGGYAKVWVDSGEPSLVDFYSYNGVGNNVVWTSPILGAGVHTVTIEATGTGSESAYAYVAIDRLSATSASGTVHIDDATVGIADQSTVYRGAYWYHCTSGCNGLYGATFYGSTVSASNASGETATVFFTGTQASLVALRAATGQTGATVSVDGGAPIAVTFTAPTTALQTIYTTPVLPWGRHTLKLISAGPTGSWAGLDEVVVTN